MIYDISQGTVDMGFGPGATSDYDFITNLLLRMLGKNFYKSSAVAEMGNRVRAKWAEK